MKQFYFLFFGLLSTMLYSQSIVINEIQAKNTNTYENPTTGEYSDWIELKNLTTSEIDISGYFLSDDVDNVKKWEFPSGTKIAANGFLLIIADDENTGLQTNFKLSSSGEEVILSKPDESELQKITYPAIQNDISYGRLSDGTYSFLMKPTPKTDNMDSDAFKLLDVDINISIPSGLYATSQTIEISKTGEGTIYYTLDGSLPTTSSSVYTSPITINNNTVLKVIAIKSPTEFSISENRSYIIGATHNLPVVLLTSDNSSFNSINKEVIDGRVAFNFIEKDGTVVINQYANFKESGKTSRGFPQLNGKIEADKVYGDGDFDYKMYPYKDIDEFDSFLLRNASQDWANTHLRDAFIARLLGKDNLTNTPFEAYRPAVLYVNAKYQGIINIREDDDKNYVKHNFGLKDDEFKVKLGQGTFVDFHSLNFNTEADRTKFSKLVDFYEHLSLKLLFAFAPPGEWGWQVWEDLSGKTGTQFHYNFHDFDPIYGLAFDGANFTNIETDLMPVNDLMETQIKDYEPYKKEAIHFISASINHIFNADRSLEILNEMQAELESEIPAHAVAMTKLADDSSLTYRTDELPFSNLSQWKSNLADLKTNISNRFDRNIFTRIKDEYSLEDPIQVTYESSDITKGFIRVHNVKSIKNTFTGTYFKNIPIRFKAEALPGYKFVRWEGDVTGNDIEITTSFASDASIKAIFEPVSTFTTNLVINEVQGKNDTTIADEAGEYDDWIEIYNPGTTAVNLAGYYISDNVSEPLKWKILDTDASKTTVASKGYLLLWADKDTDQGENHLDFKLKGTDQVILTAPDATTKIQEISFTDVDTDTSYGAKEDSDSEYIVFTTPTPGASNNSSLSTEDNNIDEVKINTYPNPTKNSVTIQGIPEEVTWKLYNINGQLVKKGIKKEFDITNLHTGLYILNINNKMNLKIVKN